MPWAQFLGGFQTALDAGARQQQLFQQQQAMQIQQQQFQQSLMQRQAEEAFRQQMAQQQFGLSQDRFGLVQDQFAYGQQRDAAGDAFRDRAFEYSMARDEVGDMFRDRAFQYQQGRDRVGDEQWQRMFGLREQAMQPQPPSPMEIAKYDARLMQNEQLRRELAQVDGPSYPDAVISDAMQRGSQLLRRMEMIQQSNSLNPSWTAAGDPEYLALANEYAQLDQSVSGLISGAMQQASGPAVVDPMQQPLDDGTGQGASAYFGVGAGPVPSSGAQPGVVYGRTPAANSYGPPPVPQREQRQPEMGGVERSPADTQPARGGDAQSVFQRLSAIQSDRDVIATSSDGPSIMEQYEDLIRRVMNNTDWTLEQRIKLAEGVNRQASSLVANALADPVQALTPMAKLTDLRRRIVSEYQ